MSIFNVAMKNNWRRDLLARPGRCIDEVGLEPLLPIWRGPFPRALLLLSSALSLCLGVERLQHRTRLRQ